jgi:hypothetical protein
MHTSQKGDNYHGQWVKGKMHGFGSLREKVPAYLLYYYN